MNSKGGVGLFWISQKERLFFISYNNQVLFGKSHDAAPLLTPSKKGLPLPFSLTKIKCTWTLISKKSLLILYSHGQKTFVMVNITPTYKG